MTTIPPQKEPPKERTFGDLSGEATRQIADPPQIKREVFDGVTDELLLRELSQHLGTIIPDKPIIIDSENQWAYIQAMRWLVGRDFQAMCPKTGRTVQGDLTKGLYLVGQSGTGKSTLLRALMELAARENVHWYYGPYVGTPSYGALGRTKVITDNLPLSTQPLRADDIATQYSRSGDINSYKVQRTLAIDDLGSEPPESLHMGNRLGVLRQVLEVRGDHDNLMTIITSNLPLYPQGDNPTNCILERYGERATSRLSMLNYLPLVGKDRRQTTTNR